jgi:hypothetical protein
MPGAAFLQTICRHRSTKSSSNPSHEGKNIRGASPGSLLQDWPEHGPVEASEHDGASAPLSTVGIALDYLAQGSSMVPQPAGGKHPCVRWKMYQTCHPTPPGLPTWFTRWPQAGIGFLALPARVGKTPAPAPAECSASAPN